MTRVDEKRQFSQLLHRPLDIGTFFDAVDRALARLVPFDSSCWLGLDPSTLLPTSHFTRESDAYDHLKQIAANEFLDEDVNKFSTLARAASPVGLLSEATGGTPARSKRFREVLAPHGFTHGDELRAVFIEGDAVWGCVALHRQHGAFTSSEAQLVADLGAIIGEGIHRAVLLTALMTGPGPGLPGLILVRPDGSIESITPAAASFLAEIVDSTGRSPGLPLVVASLVAKVRGTGPTEKGEGATARLPRKAGGWHLLYASLLDGRPDGRVGVMVYPEKVPELPPVVAAAHDLTSREREVTSLVLQGCSTQEISARLHVSPYTVQDHLKKVFAKVGVRSRRELVAQIFAQHYAPRLGADSSINADGGLGHSVRRPGQPRA
jgi:DNA-binding CsgD family transcriptional regulator